MSGHIVPTPVPSLSVIKAVFNGSSSFRDYNRGGAYVPDIAANSAISATAVGLKMSQFAGARRGDVSIGSEAPFGDLGVNATISYNSNGTITITGGTASNWLIGTAASDYQIRFSNLSGPDAGDVSGTFDTWMDLSSSRSVSLSGASPGDTKTASCTVEIRDKTELDVRGSGTIDLETTNI